MNAILDGVRVLDLSRVLAGPWVGQMLADLGADVVKVERPGTGDEARTHGALPEPRPGMNTVDRSGFGAVNRGKRSIEVDIATVVGQDVVRQLALQADVLIENFKTGDLARYGLGYDDLAKLNPRLVYCSITGFGQTGPYRHLPGYDLIFQAMSGLMSTTGHPDDQPGGGPQRVGYPISDVTAGLFAAIGVLSALYHRDARGGLGQQIDLALLDAQIAAMSVIPTNFLMTGSLPPRMGIASLMSCPYQAFDCADGQIVICANNDKQFAALCHALQLVGVAEDPRFATNALRVKHRDSLEPLLAGALARLSVETCRQTLLSAHVPCGPIHDFRQVFQDEHVVHRGVQQEVSHPTKGLTPILANPLKFSSTPVTYRKGPPQLGEHNAEVLGDWVGIDDRQLQGLREAGALGSSDLERAGLAANAIPQSGV